MADKPRRGFFPYILLALLLLLVAFVAYLQLKPKNDLPVVQKAPPITTLQDLDGKPFDTSTLSGSVRLMEFIYTSCPDICPATTFNMVKIQNVLKDRGLFGDKVKMIAITFDPEHDTPEVMREYAKRMQMDMTGWTLLRGDEAETKRIAREYGVSVQNLGDGNFMHTVTSLQLIDDDDRVRNVYEMGTDMDNDRIVADIEKLVKEST